MSSADTAWLRMDTPTNIMMITGVIVLRSPVHLNALRQIVNSRFACIERFRRVPRQYPVGAWWERDRQFDIAKHVIEISPGQPLDQRGLEALAGKMASTPLPAHRPRWQFQLVPAYKTGSAVICRIHHSYADGIALIKVLLSMTDTESNPTHHRGAPPPHRHTERGLLDQIFHDARALTRLGSETGKQLLQDRHRMAHGVDALHGLTSNAKRLVADVARFTFRPADAKSRYRGRLGANKHVAWADPLPLDDVKTIAKAHGATVNDVLVAVVAGALHGWLDEQGQSTDGLEIHATVPVNLRPEELAGELGNHFGVVFLGIPVGVADPLARLRAVSQQMTQLKRSFQPQISLGLLSLFGRGPSGLQRRMLELFSSKASLVLTNVPGPRTPLYLAGSEIDKLLFWVPQSGSIGLGISILSYNGKVQFGLMSDCKLVAHPAQIIRRVAAEFEKLVLLTLMSPVSETPGVQHD